jgi:hypothetical protein
LPDVLKTIKAYLENQGLLKRTGFTTASGETVVRDDITEAEATAIRDFFSKP